MSSLEIRPPLDGISDDVLLARVTEMVGRSRRVEVELVWHLAEVDKRRLYLREACPSMHVYATTRLHLSDAEAYLRITAARLSRRFPMVLDMLVDGRLHLSAIAKLAPHLREDSAEVLLGRAARRSKRDIELLVAELAPRPDVPSRMRRLPDAPAVRAAVAAAESRPDGVSCREVADIAARSTEPGASMATAPALAVIFERAMTLLVRELERVRFAATDAPRKAAHEADPTPDSRRIPDPIRRLVWTRDEERCTFRDRKGRRCPARQRLEFHHLVPFGQGGDHSPSNVMLRCAGHNAYQADLDFGAAFMAASAVALGPASDGPHTGGGFLIPAVRSQPTRQSGSRREKQGGTTTRLDTHTWAELGSDHAHLDARVARCCRCDEFAGHESGLYWRSRRGGRRRECSTGNDAPG